MKTRVDPSISRDASAAREGLSRAALRLLRRLDAPDSYAFRDGEGWVVAIARNGASLRAGGADEASAQALLAQGLASLDAPAASGRARLRANEAGLAFLRRLDAEPDQAFLAQHAVLERRSVEGEARLVDAQESPLAWLARRKLVDAASFEAGERLRCDMEAARMLPRTTLDWSRVGGRAPRRADGLHVAEMTLAARQRVARALDAVGPDLSGLLIDVCGFLKGLETVEGERGWPRRSGKVALGLALAALARHYGLGAAQGPAHGRLRHWGAQDYRPVIDATGAGEA
ncbi:MAG: DUF6456 domain-containing protein [Beijerinckiaceae bacterium]